VIGTNRYAKRLMRSGSIVIGTMRTEKSRETYVPINNIINISTGDKCRIEIVNRVDGKTVRLVVVKENPLNYRVEHNFYKIRKES
jgi:hypothetical protein